jgi:hypothetical protein
MVPLISMLHWSFASVPIFDGVVPAGQLTHRSVLLLVPNWVVPSELHVLGLLVDVLLPLPVL